MSVPMATTTVTVYAQAEAEPGEGRTASVRQADVAAHVSSPSGTEAVAPGGGAETVDAVLLCDPVDGMGHTDTITTAEGDTFDVVWVERRRGLGLDHMRAGLRRRTGVAV